MVTGRDERLFTGYTGRISIVLAVGLLVANLGRQALPPLLPAIIDGLAISAAEAGFALTVLWSLYALTQFPAGRFADELTRKTTLVVGLGVMISGFAVVSLVRDYYTLLVGVALVGSGAAFYFITVRILLSDLYVRRRGEAFGFNSAVGQLGSVLAAGLAVVAVTYATWRTAFIPVAALLFVTLLGLHHINRESYQLDRVRFGIRGTTARVFGTVRIRRLVVAYTLVIFAWQGGIGFLPTFLYVEKGFSTAFASAGFAFVYLVGMIVQPIAGRLSDRVSRIPVAGASAVLSALGLSLLLFSTSVVTIAISIVLFATGLMSFSPVLQAYLMDVFPDDSKGGDFGAFKTIYEGLGSFGATYVGIVAATAGYAPAFGGLVACLVASAGILYSLHRRAR